MTSLPKLFLTTGAIAVLIGMGWGILMAATQDHTLAPAHAHLNLVGFVLMSIYALYYALTPGAAQTGLARLHYGLALLGVVLIVPGIVMTLQGQSDLLAKSGSVVTLAAMLVFLAQILRHGVGARSAA